MNIRKFQENDFKQVWPIVRKVIQAQKTFALNPNMTKQEAYTSWVTLPQVTYVAEEGTDIVGTYFLKSNLQGPGSHICNCGYMVASQLQNRGVATMLNSHSEKIALELGYKAIQFNAVVSCNEAAVYLWKKQGYKIVGEIPKGYNHKTRGFVNLYIMYKWLET